MTTELPEAARALLDPRIFPDETFKVELIQTQMSFIFLTGKYVYKLKKPVDLGYLDYSTLEKRRFFCQQEVKLNQMLCAAAYVGVIPIQRNPNGISLGGPGETIEYAVKMLYLPQDRMLPTLLGQNRVTLEMLDRLASKLAAFHSLAETSPRIGTFGSIEAIRINTEENFSQTEKYVGTLISAKQHQRIKENSDLFLWDKSALFKQRVSTGRIRDCHGDLHAQHICFNNGICIFDCVEFNDRFRYCDVASEIAFLAMDVDHYGRADLSHQFVQDYIRFSGDLAIKELLKFYKSYRAYVRGKVACFKSEDPYISAMERQQAIDSARSYFELADAYLRPRPILFITVGLVGSGKTTVAQVLAKRLGLTVISSDIVRKQMASIPQQEHRLDDMDTGIYSTEFSRQVYDKLFSDAKSLLRQGDSVVLDASFIKSQERQTAQNIAAETDSDFFILECVLDEENTHKRLMDRFKGNSVSDGRWDIYGPQKKKFDPVSGIPTDRHLIIDTVLPLPDQITQFISNI